MPLGMKPVCTTCKSNASTMWTKNEKGEIVCNECTTKQSQDGKEQNGNGIAPGKKGTSSIDNAQERVLRKSARNKPSKYRITNNKPLTSKGKGRRIIFKKSQPVRAPTSVSTVVTGESTFHDGMYYQNGDIVSLVDDDDNVFFAQIRGFLQDQYYEKSAVITWLLPTRATDRTTFDPSTYILGPEEDLPRKLEFMEFVCHAPSDYYKNSKTPYPTVDNSPNLCYIWSSLGPEIRIAPKLDEIFGMSIPENTSSQTVSKKSKLDKVEKVKIKDEKRFIVVE